MARIKIDFDRRLGAVDRQIYGSFVEHLGRCIYGGIYEEGSPLSDARGFRTDVLGAAQYDLSDALAVTSYLNVFIRQCRTVRLANFAQLVNAIGAIFTNTEGLFLQTVYHPLRLYAEHMRDVALDPFVECETYDLRPEDETSPCEHRVADLGPFPLLDVAATTDEQTGTLVLGVVNRDRERPISTTIELQDGRSAVRGIAYEVNGDGPEVLNTFERPDAVTVRERRLEPGACLAYEFPAHSVTVPRFDVA